MSWLPLFSSFFIFLFLVSFFFWSKLGLIISILGFSYLLSYFYSEVSGMVDRRFFSFLLFMGGEAMVFLTLFFTSLWLEDENVSPISVWSSLPLEGCYLLIASSLSITVFHNWYNPVEGRAWWFLFLSMVLGLSFVVLQFCEMWECLCDLTFCSYYSASFSTVGLHFLHVVIGLFMLYIIYHNYVGSAGLSYYYVTISIWYWHFVDYIWLAVFVVVYLL